MIDRIPKYDVESSSGPKNVMSQWYRSLSKVLDEFVKSKKDKPDLEVYDTVCSCEDVCSGSDLLSR